MHAATTCASAARENDEVFQCSHAAGSAGVPGGHVSAVVHQPGDVGGCARRRSCMKRGGAFVVHSVDVRSSFDQGRGDLDPAIGRAGCGVERCRPAEAPGIDVCAGRQERQNRGER